MGFLCLLLLGLLGVSSSLESGEDGGCPKSCSCSVVGITQLIAVCSGFNATQKFDKSIGTLTIENARGVVLNDNIFHTVGLTDIQSITIASSVFQRMDPKAFSDLESLSYLKLEGNNQMILSADMFRSTNVMHLFVRQSKLTFMDHKSYLFDIPTVSELELINCDVAPLLNVDSFSKMPRLQYINLASNMIRDVELMFSGLEDLEHVDLSDNLISEIKPDLFASTSLDILVLHKNPLSSLDNVIIPKLTELDLSLCKFNKIDTEMFAGLPMLTRLNLSGNAISEIESNAFSKLTDLIHIDLSNNALKDHLIPDLFIGNSPLQVISFAHNPSLRVLPAQLFRGMDDLYNLDLSYCGLTSLNEELFKGLNSLTNLNLAGNVLSQIEANTLTGSIIQLDLSHNNITDVNKIKFTPGSRIQTLFLANNKLNEISTNSFKNLEFLTILDLHFCGLRNLWVTNKNERSAVLRTLRALYLSKNNIQQILPRQLQLTPHLDVLDISENRLICDANFHATLKWLEAHSVQHLSTFVPQRRHSRDVLPGHPYGNDGLAHPNLLDSAEIGEPISPRSWNVIESLVCGHKMREELERQDPEDEEDVDEEEKEDDDEDDYYVQSKQGKPHDKEIKQISVEERYDDIDLWPIIIVAISGIAILLSLSVLSCFVLRWYRQRNSYGAAMIKHLNTPRLKRDRSSIYQQLHEEINSPTTPVMSIKLGKQEYSKVTPQSV